MARVKRSAISTASKALLLLLVIGVIGVAGWQVRGIVQTTATKTSSTTDNTTNNAPATTSDVWKTYESSELMLSFEYPGDWRVVNYLDKAEPTINIQSPDFTTNTTGYYAGGYYGTQIYISSKTTKTENTIVNSESKDVRLVTLDGTSGYSMSQNLNDQGYKVLLYGIDLHTKGQRFFLYQSNIKEGTSQKDDSTDLNVFNKILDSVTFQ